MTSSLVWCFKESFHWTKTWGLVVELCKLPSLSVPCITFLLLSWRWSFHSHLDMSTVQPNIQSLKLNIGFEHVQKTLYEKRTGTATLGFHHCQIRSPFENLQTCATRGMRSLFRKRDDLKSENINLGFYNRPSYAFMQFQTWKFKFIVHSKLLTTYLESSAFATPYL